MLKIKTNNKVMASKKSIVLLILSLMFVCILLVLNMAKSQISNGYDLYEEEDSGYSSFIDRLKFALNPYQGDIEESNKGNSNVINANDKYNLLHGDVIMPELGDPVVRAELGRATWHLLHSVTGRFPENPTKEESEALTQFVYLTARLYPCGDCAKHFQRILEKLGPATDSRKDASEWICKVHNGANKFLKKEIFDCDKVAERWPCNKCEESNTNERRFKENLKLE